MVNGSTRDRRWDFDRHRYEQIVSTAIAAVKGGDRAQARQLLQKAIAMDPGDVRPWLWLSGTTDDLTEQREYLEHAVAAEPGNMAARRGLVMLAKKLDGKELLEIGEQVEARSPQDPEEAQVEQNYLCAQCGGRLRFDVELHDLKCEHCGAIQVIEAHRPEKDVGQVLDFVLPTISGHRWSEAQHRLGCEQCGAITLVPTGESMHHCPYCGSSHLLETQESEELIDPSLIGLVKLTEDEVLHLLQDWLGSGFYIPDDLKKKVQTSALRMAYYPFWTFDGTLEVRWMCEVNVGSGRAPSWVSRDGYEFENFDDILVSGVKALPQKHLQAIYPFELDELVEFQPEYLAGCSAVSYDISLAKASLKAREKVARKVRDEIYQRVEIGREKRNVRTGAMNWSGMTFKYLLLPIWVGNFVYKQKEYRILINAQTGKIGGEKPVDRFKVFAVMIGSVLVFLTLVLLMILMGLIFGLITL